MVFLHSDPRVGGSIVVDSWLGWLVWLAWLTPRTMREGPWLDALPRSVARWKWGCRVAKIKSSCNYADF